MVGLSGVVGSGAPNYDPETVPATVAGESETAYRDATAAVHGAFHAEEASEQPVETADGSLVWVWGEVYSITDGASRSSVDPARTAETCASAYDDYGMDFVSLLDGEFVGCIYHPGDGQATFFIDRLGARPLYVASGADGLAFSTNVQTVPEVTEFAFDDDYLSEYLYARRTFGTKTPVDGIAQVPPATTMTYDVDTGATDYHRYWRPQYQPVDKPFSYFVREFAERFERAVADRTGGDCGLLLSGGSDSRAVLAAAESPLRTYHLADGQTRESETARRVAAAADAPFERLDRGPDYHATLLKRAAPIMEFIGAFHTGHALGFADTIAGDVDALLTGLYSDDLFGAWSVPQHEISLPFDATLFPPLTDFPTSLDSFVESQVGSGETRQPSYLTGSSYADVLRSNIAEEANGRVDFHGVTYESLSQLALHRSLFPVTNGIGFDLYSALQIAPTRNPFLDRRLVDLHLSMPLKYRLRRDIVHDGIEALSPALARLPHASSRLPVSYPKAAHAVGKRVSNQLDKLGPASYRTDGPWQDKNEVVRRTDFVERSLESNAETMRAIPCLDADAAFSMHRRHCAGEIHVGEELYRLITVLETPLAERLV